MKTYIRRYRRFFWGIFASFFISAFSILGIPLLNILPEKMIQICSYLIATIFWTGFLLGVILVIVANKKMVKVREVLFEKMKKKEPVMPGLFRFSRGIPQVAIYTLIGIGILLSVSDVILGYIPTVIMFFIIFMTYMAIVIHAIVDGKNYKVYKMLKEGINNEHKQKKKDE